MSPFFQSLHWLLHFQSHCLPNTLHLSLLIQYQDKNCCWDFMLASNQTMMLTTAHSFNFQKYLHAFLPSTSPFAVEDPCRYLQISFKHLLSLILTKKVEHEQTDYQDHCLFCRPILTGLLIHTYTALGRDHLSIISFGKEPLFVLFVHT